MSSVAKCLCGHGPFEHHESGRGRCFGAVVIYLAHPGDDELRKRPGPVLTKDEAEVVIRDIQNKVSKAPSYERQARKALGRTWLRFPCVCKLFHTLPIPEPGIA